DAGKKLLAERRIRPEILAGRITQEIDQQEDHFPECAIVHETFAPRLIPQGGICLSRKPDPAEAAAMSPELPPRMFAASLFHPKKVGIRAAVGHHAEEIAVDEDSREFVRLLHQ